MELKWMNVTVDVKNKNERRKEKRARLVNNACGCAAQGLTAVMGPSGCGKTTFITTLAGRISTGTKTTGCVLYNGQERELKNWMGSMGFVDQDDSFFEKLTAYETVYYAAQFRLKEKNVDIKSRIMQLFRKLRICDIMDCRVRVLSGGERKRVMIAVELITDPQVIFLDEPTSGLDNDVAFSIVTLLKELANEGKIIFMSIHQPDDRLALLFDKIILMSRGEIVTAGTMQECNECLLQQGYARKENTTFSSFAMEVLGNASCGYNESSIDNKLTRLAGSYRKQFNCEGKYQNVRTGNDFYVDLSPSLMEIGLLIHRKFNLDLFRKKTLLLYVVTLVLMASLFYFGGVETVVNHMISEQNTSKLVDKSFVVETFKWLCVRIALSLGFLLCIIPAAVSNTVFSSERRVIQREINVQSYTVTSYYLSVLIFELCYNFPLILCYLTVMLLRFCPKPMLGLCIICQILEYWFVMCLGLMLISVFHGEKKSLMCSVLGLIVHFLAGLFSSTLLVADKQAGDTKPSKMTIALSMHPSAIFRSFMRMMIDSITNANLRKKLLPNVFTAISRNFDQLRYFKCANLIYLSKHICLAIGIISSLVFVFLGIVFQLRLLSPKIRMKLCRSN